MYYPEKYVARELVIPTQQPPLLVFVVLVGAVFGYALSCILGGPSADEGFHAPQVWHFYSGGTSFADNLTVPPTYHYTLATIVRLIGYYSDHLLRLINLSIALCMLPLVYRLAQMYYPQEAGIRMLQLFFIPLLFPFFFLIYTDTWALLALTLTFYCVLNRMYVCAGLAGLLAISIRQDSVIWVGFAYLLIVFEVAPLRELLTNWQSFRKAFVRGVPLLMVFALFIAFVIVNGGVAVGDKGAHQIQQFNITNLYVFLICAWLLFLPLNIYSLNTIIPLLRRPWVAALLMLGFLVYMGTFSNPHGYNNTLYSFFLHNGLLYVMMEYISVRALLYIPIAWMALTLCTMKMPEKRFHWLLLIIPVAVICHPLVEPRYYFPAYLLIQLWRPAVPHSVEVLTLGNYVVFAAFIMFGTVTGMFFL